MEAAGVSVNGTHSHLQGGQSVSKTEKSGSRNTSLLFTDLETESKRNNEEGLAKGWAHGWVQTGERGLGPAVSHATSQNEWMLEAMCIHDVDEKKNQM